MNQPIEQLLDEVDAELKRWGNVAKFRTDTVRRLSSELRQRLEREQQQHREAFQAGWDEGFQEAQRPDEFPQQNRCEVIYHERFGKQ